MEGRILYSFGFVLFSSVLCIPETSQIKGKFLKMCLQILEFEETELINFLGEKFTFHPSIISNQKEKKLLKADSNALTS